MEWKEQKWNDIIIIILLIWMYGNQTQYKKKDFYQLVHVVLYSIQQ